MTAGTAEADLISFTYSGTITTLNDVNNVFGGKIHLGDSYTGTLTYDTAAVDQSSDPNIGAYQYSRFTSTPFVSPLGLTITVGSGANQVVFLPVYGNIFTIDVFNNQVSTVGPSDGFQAIQVPSLDGTSLLGGLLGLALADRTQTALSSDALPTDLRLADFTDGMIQMTGTDQNSGTRVTILEGTIDGVGAVPEPASFALTCLGGLVLVGVARCRSRRRD